MRLKFKLLALMDFLKHYAMHFKAAWHNRNHDIKEYQSAEADFLPAALALQKKPMSPLPRVTLWVLSIFSIITLLWSIFGRVDVVANGSGKIINTGRSKAIQSFQQASIKKIWVKDGQKVKKEDILIEFDSGNNIAEQLKFLNEIKSQELELHINQQLLSAIQNKNQPTFKSDEIENKINAEFLKVLQESKEEQNIVFSQIKNDVLIAKNNLMVQYQDFESKISAVQAQIIQVQANLNSNQQKISNLQETLPISIQKEQDLANLVAEEFISKHSYLEKKQLRLEQEGLLKNETKQRQEIIANIAVYQKQIALQKAEIKKQATEKIVASQQKIQQAQQNLIQVTNNQNLMAVKSPIDGVVQQLAVHTIKGVVSPAQQLMVIAPEQDGLELEAMILNKDIGFIYPKQAVNVKIESFLYTKYGTIDGEVISISKDAIIDEKLGPLYSARIQLKKDSMNIDGRPVRLIAGMNATAEIKIGKRRVIEYFLSPFQVYQKESLRER